MPTTLDHPVDVSADGIPERENTAIAISDAHILGFDGIVTRDRARPAWWQEQKY
jgi:hypothetical protein